MPVWLLVLGVGALVFYTDDYVIAGVIPEIAADLAVSEAVAGQLVTAFSLTVAIASPVIAIGAARIRGRALLGTAAAVFTLANALAAGAPDYPTLVALRVLAALAAAAATPMLFGTAAALAPAERVGRYVAVVAFGVTGAIAVGVPVGTWIGGAFGWRTTFAFMAVAGLVFGVAARFVLPPGTGVREALPVRQQLAILVRPAVSLGLAANLVLMLGSMMVLTYLAPYVDALADAGPGQRGVLFAVSGAAGMLGIWAGGVATDRWGPDRALIAGVAAFVAAMAALLALWPWRPVPVVLLAPVVAVWVGRLLELARGPGAAPSARGTGGHAGARAEHVGHLPRCRRGRGDRRCGARGRWPRAASRRGGRGRDRGAGTVRGGASGGQLVEVEVRVVNGVNTGLTIAGSSTYR
ncbi:MFS transporter [Saccharomonospora azurea]|uniref:MFS transporter n=1 Tax=Saccharomonospora azurea TaxID=40988 RepID=UPI0020D252F7|nr:MFS transporter [Saccharomonospora azurea]